MISLKSSGSFAKTMVFLQIMRSNRIFAALERGGQQGVDALSHATPRETGRTAGSWRYRVTHVGGRHSINWYNTDVEDGVNIAVILQYGHGTGTGGYVEGRDYINPALRPIFDKIAADVWREVQNA